MTKSNLMKLITIYTKVNKVVKSLIPYLENKLLYLQLKLL